MSYKFEGTNYDSNLTKQDIAKMARRYVKKQYPTCKFSIRSKQNSIYISLVEADFFVVENEKLFGGKELQINQYYLEEAPISDEAKKMFSDIKYFLNNYNFDDSDSQTDYFHTNFYSHYSVGSWEKGFIQK